jgi:hypothetical protein
MILNQPELQQNGAANGTANGPMPVHWLDRLHSIAEFFEDREPYLH